MRLRAAVGALAERNFRLLFASSTISGLGDGISVVALVFAVLHGSDSAIASNLPGESWAAFCRLPLTRAELQAIARNVAPYLTATHANRER